MGQKLYKFRANSLDEVYRRMRQKLGGDAVVIDTQEVNEGGVLGLFGQRKFELTAAAAPPPGEKPGASAPEKTAGPANAPARKPTPIERKYAASSASTGSGDRMTETVAHFQQIVKQAQKRMGQPSSKSAQTTRKEEPAVIPFRPEEPARVSASKAKIAEQTEEVRRGVEEIRNMMRVLMAETSGSGPQAEFASHYRRLVKLGMARGTAASLITEVVNNTDLNLLRDTRVFLERLKFMVRKRVAVTGGVTLTPGIRRTVAFVGATGVGKTTNLAKLAAEYAVRQHVHVALVTCDTYRVAAPEQLRVYANILDLPMEVVNDAREMGAAMQKFSGYDLILIDTAGGSQFNLEQIDELKHTLAPARPDEVLLLMGANTQLHELYNTLDSFQLVHPTSVFFTKLDETRQYGALYSLLDKAELPLSYLSVGQNVPDDIEVAKPGRVAGLVVEGVNSRDRSSTKSA
ncbi:MAG: Flagellar biosynthesis protein FlhF [Candidatus Hydrogenedentes bacterium]|nr:Flagellar biosynthesis protein FlhF [Candidatus Hydrogenedentota bacterium]